MDEQVMPEFIDKIGIIAAVIGKYAYRDHNTSQYTGYKRAVDLVKARFTVKVEIGARHEVGKKPSQGNDNNGIEIIAEIKFL
jgi:hypothetical protein